MRREVSGYGQVPQGFPERKGTNVEVSPVTVDFPTAAAPPFTVDGQRDGHFVGENIRANVPLEGL
jgi:hypothetical protein